MFDLQNSSWLLLGGKLCVTLFIVADSVYLSLRCETEAWFLVSVSWGKPLKVKGSVDIFSFEFRLIFWSCPVVSVFFKKSLLGKSYPFSFVLLTSFQLFLYDHVFF